MPFRWEEIAYQAECDRHESPEFAEEAWNLCAEDPDSRARKIQELRDMIYERGECQPPQMDDAFLLRFLRARRSVPARAHRLMVRYCKFREQNPHLWRGVDWFGMRRLGNVFEGVLYDRPDVGRFILCRLGLWDPDKTPVEDLIRGTLLLLEVGIMQPKLQVLGGVAMVDCAGMTMKHMRHLTPSIALQAMNVLGYAFPLHQRGVHVVNCSRVFETLFYFFKRLAPADELWKKVYFHNDLASLHRYIDPECLPIRYGGKRQEASLYTWLTKIKQYRNKTFDDDICKLGYTADYDEI
ncbi:clavesin-1-like [Cydia amplana]|uniref:clavesin-1-like n=1 Tax=Cydia amplana TaxID=1869771 RepID=UPI002FE5D5AC